MNVGIDIIEISDFKERISRSGSIFLDRIFTLDEQTDLNPVHLAGIFCVKECLVKIGVIKPGEWLIAEIINGRTGKPTVYIDGKKSGRVSVSISHSKNYAVAVVMKY